MNFAMYYIYALVDPRTNQPFYVGKGLKSNQRHLDHFNESLSTTSNRHKFFKIQALQREGLDVLIQILQDNIIDENIAYQTETYYIQLYGRKNIDDDGVLTNICLDQKPPNQKGKKQSAEHIAARTKSYQTTCQARGKKSHKPETKKKIARHGKNNAFYGKHHSDKVKMEHSQRMKGNKNNSKTYRFQNPEGAVFIVRGRFYDFCREQGLAISTMEKALRTNTIPNNGKCKGWSVMKLETNTILQSEEQ